MQHFPLTLAGWDDWIWLILVGATVIGSWIGNIKKQSQKQRRIDEGPAADELEAMAARRREELRRQAQQRSRLSGSDEPGNLTMAERIARARAKAQYEERARSISDRSPEQAPNEAQRRALAEHQAELERRRQAARARQQARLRAQQQAQRQARQQAQLRAQQQQVRQRAQAHAQAVARARQRGVLIHEHAPAPKPTESQTRRLVPEKPTPVQSLRPTRVTGKDSSQRLINSADLTPRELRRAIVLNEVLGKPLALRQSAGYMF